MTGGGEHRAMWQAEVAAVERSLSVRSRRFVYVGTAQVAHHRLLVVDVAQHLGRQGPLAGVYGIP